MDTILGLSYIAVLPLTATVILYLLNKKTAFGRIKEGTKQIIFGLIFGGLAVIGTEFGVDVGGAVANTRDASVLSAGLVFGAPAGLIAGFIGGIERFLCVLWRGEAYEYTRLACSLSTIIAGIFGAILRKHMFDDKKPSVIYALAIGLVTEVMHMLMIFITNMSDVANAFVFVKRCSIPMITVNGLAVMLSVLAVGIIGKGRHLFLRRRRHQIASVAQRWLLICVVSAFMVTCLFTSFLQIQVSDNNTRELLHLNIDDVIADIAETMDKNMLELTERAADRYVHKIPIADIAWELHVYEINIVDNNGIITKSTNPDFVNFDMKEKDQSREFLVLLNGTHSFVQDYRAISFSDDILRKYAGVALNDGGFIQVGYDYAQLYELISKEVVDATINRHIGKSGYLMIADENGNIVSGNHTGNNIHNTELGKRISNRKDTDDCFTADLFGEKVYCAYQYRDGYFGIAVLPESEAIFSRDISIYMMVFMEVVIFVGLFILTYFLIKKLVVDNIKSVNKSLSQITGGNLNVTVNVRSSEEFALLSDDINATVDTLKHLIAEAAARIDRELEVAKIIQESSLPSVFSPFSGKREIDIYATMDAAKEVGGDFYDFYPLDGDHLAFLVADVSGKGVTGAMFMMKAKTLIKSFAEQGGDVSEILTKANSALCEGNDAEMFVTCFMCILDLKNGKIEFANAGHNPPLIRHGDGSFEFFKTRPGFVLGGMEGVRYKKGEIDFLPGDAIFLYTDGVTEAMNAEEKLYGEDRLISIINSAEAQNAKELCRRVKNDVEVFVGEAPQFDDITMMCVSTNKSGNNERDKNE